MWFPRKILGNYVQENYEEETEEFPVSSDFMERTEEPARNHQEASEHCKSVSEGFCTQLWYYFPDKFRGIKEANQKTLCPTCYWFSSTD